MIRIVITHKQIEPSGVKSTWWVIPAIAGVIVWVLTFAITLVRLLVEEFTISALQKPPKSTRHTCTAHRIKHFAAQLQPFPSPSLISSMELSKLSMVHSE